MDAPPASRLATVSAALLLGGGPPASDPARLAGALARLFEDVMWVGGEPPPGAAGRGVPDVEGPACALRGLVSALASARSERVLVLDGRLRDPAPELLLALVAWPEADLVRPRTPDGAQPLCAIYRRARVLELARARLAEGRLALHELASALETAELDPAELARLDLDVSALARE